MQFTTNHYCVAKSNISSSYIRTKRKGKLLNKHKFSTEVWEVRIHKLCSKKYTQRILSILNKDL